MSSSIAALSSGSSALISSSNVGGASAAQFREIHKNTWLKRLTAEGKKITVGPKKSERSWVVFCVHDDTEALLEGYAEPRQAAAHNPEWIVSMQDTLHISHALIPNSHEFEFVVTLSNEVLRFHAMSWEIMQEWVETLRSKLREMKIISPRENLYTKLPEVRAPLLPTRDPTSPLPAPPPVPAALVPGVERVVPQSSQQEPAAITTHSYEPTTTPTTTLIPSTSALSAPNDSNATNSTATTTSVPSFSSHNAQILSAMSNTLTQNLLNMLSNPINTYSEQLNDEAIAAAAGVYSADDDASEQSDADSSDDAFLAPLLRKSNRIPAAQRELENSVRVDIAAGNRASADHIKNFNSLLQCERLIPRPQTSRSLSAGAADKSKKEKTAKNSTSTSSSCASQSKTEAGVAIAATARNDNVTALEICVDTGNSNAARATDDDTAGSTTTADPNTNITIIQVSTTNSKSVANEADVSPPKLPVKSIIADIFKFPETMAATAAITKLKQHEYKSNVQIIPSNLNSSTIQVLGQHTAAASATATPNQYSSPVRKLISSHAHAQAQAANSSAAVTATANTSSAASGATAIQHGGDSQKVTKLHVSGNAGAGVTIAAPSVVYGTCYTITADTHAPQTTPQMQKKIILSANTSGVTNISVNNAADCAQESDEAVKRNRCSIGATPNTYAAVGDISVNVHYEKIFLSSSIPIAASNANTGSTSVAAVTAAAAQASPQLSAQRKSPRRCPTGLPTTSTTESSVVASHSAADALKMTLPSSPLLANSVAEFKTPQRPVTASSHNKHMSSAAAATATSTTSAALLSGSPALQRRRIASPHNQQHVSAGGAGTGAQPLLPTRPPLLKRGLTEAVITTRPSRKDFHFLRLTPTKSLVHNGRSNVTPPTTANSNNNDEVATTSANNGAPLPPQHAAVGRTSSESLEQRRRSSSTSDTQAAGRSSTRNTNNNEFSGNRAGSNNALRIQQPPQPFRSVENGLVSGGSPSTTTAGSPAAKRITLREQQVLQLRREIMHPGGVRLQLRRKDCVGSIAWVDAFGAVWVAGWKQKEHPVLYNALHIGDQLISITGIAVNTAGEANKIIRNANTLFVEVLVRRLPFGRGYAIRREREGQCLGLIRDGNTATIVDVVPNSLAARHGLPPKAQSCDGTTLTFWVLTEINGRPLNLFFKDHEIRDRLNSVGRDISILVQPSDLITKLKKQLKSLRGYKDYLVQ